MTAKLLAALLAPLLLSGCMMAGMVGMGRMGVGAHGGSPADARSAPTVVREVIGGGFRVTADFPSFTPVDSLSYSVTLRGLDGTLITADASVALEVSPAITESVAASPTPAHTRHPAPSATAMPSGLAHMQFAPVERGGGRFVFRPSIPRGGAYRLAVVVERVGETTLDPPIVVDHVVALPASAPPSAEPGHVMPSGGLTALGILGGVSMAVLMLLVMR